MKNTNESTKDTKKTPVYNFSVQMENMNEKSFHMLQRQKMEILKLINEGKASYMMDGIVYLIDLIQDSAVDKNGIPEEVVFPKEPEVVSTICHCVRCQG